MRIRPYVVLCLALLAGVPASAQQVVEEIVAKVNDQIIQRSDYQRNRESLQAELKQQSPADADVKFAQRDKDVLRDMIDEKLLMQRGKGLGMSVESDVIKRLDEMRKDAGLESMEDLEKAAQQQGVSFEDFKERIRTGLMTQKVIGQEVGRHVNIAPTEVSKFYEEHKNEMVQPEEISLAEILVSTEAPQKGSTALPTASMDASRVSAAGAKAQALLDSIRKGGKFEDVAKASSDGPTASEGGVLGTFRRGALAAEIEEKIYPLKVGEVSDVIQTKQGFIILKVLEHHPKGIPAQKEVENQIMEQIYYVKLQPALREYLTKLREDAFIDVKAGYTDTGASPNQTKPVFTDTIAEAQAKKAKKKKKLGIF